MLVMPENVIKEKNEWATDLPCTKISALPYRAYLYLLLCRAFVCVCACNVFSPINSLGFYRFIALSRSTMDVFYRYARHRMFYNHFLLPVQRETLLCALATSLQRFAYYSKLKEIVWKQYSVLHFTWLPCSLLAYFIILFTLTAMLINIT